MFLISYIDYVGIFVISLSESLGRFFIFFGYTLKIFFSKRSSLRKIVYYMNKVGVESLSIIILTGTFTGMVLALQTYIGFQRVGGEQFIGSVVALGLIRELGPVLTGLMVTGRAGSAMAAEIGTMRITEQLDALETLHINVFQYLIVPRIVASAIILPCLAIFSMIFGIIGGYVVCVGVLELSAEDFISSIRNFVELDDVYGGLQKSFVFGIILSWVGTYKGYYTDNGARGVGLSTTQAVVLSSISILIADYFLTKLLEQL